MIVHSYCLPCLCFASVGAESPFSSTGFSKWEKALGKKSSLLDKHQESEAQLMNKLVFSYKPNNLV
jgi:hypothetical protein